MGLIELIIVLAIVGVIVALASSNSRSTAKAVLVVLCCLFGAGLLVGLPAIWYMRAGAEYKPTAVIESANTQVTVNGHSIDIPDVPMEVVAPVPPVPATLLAESNFDNEVFDSSIRSNKKRTGKFIGRDSQAWSSEVERKNLADVYSSDEEAIASLVRQLPSVIRSGSDVVEVFLNPSPQLHTQSDRYVFLKREIRKLIPNARLVSVNDGSAILVSLSEDRKELKTHTMRVRRRPDESDYELFAKSVDKPWVKSDIEFRESGNVPSDYMVVWGSSGLNHDQVGSCTSLATAELEKRVAFHMEIQRGHHHLASSESSRITNVVVQSLTMDQFVQRFEQKLDGSDLATPIMREALLLNTSEQELSAAVRHATRGESYSVNKYVSPNSKHAHTVRASVRNRDNSFDPKVLFGFSVMVLGCFGMLRGFSWFFDRQ